LDWITGTYACNCFQWLAIACKFPSLSIFTLKTGYKNMSQFSLFSSYRRSRLLSTPLRGCPLFSRHPPTADSSLTLPSLSVGALIERPLAPDTLRAPDQPHQPRPPLGGGLGCTPFRIGARVAVILCRRHNPNPSAQPLRCQSSRRDTPPGCPKVPDTLRTPDKTHQPPHYHCHSEGEDKWESPA